MNFPRLRSLARSPPISHMYDDDDDDMFVPLCVANKQNERASESSFLTLWNNSSVRTQEKMLLLPLERVWGLGGSEREREDENEMKFQPSLSSAAAAAAPVMKNKKKSIAEHL
jgi:hypothetical protein